MTSRKKLLAFSIGLGLLVLAPLTAMAAEDDATTTINAVIASTISISSSGTVTLNVTPVSGGSQTSASDTVTVSTNNAAGYTLTLADSDDDNDLVNGSDTIAAHDGTAAEPSALDNNTWGYAIAGSPFDASYSTINNAGSSTTKWAGVPLDGDPDTLKTTNATASGDTTTVWFSVKADTSNPNGTYSDTVTYTATTN